MAPGNITSILSFLLPIFKYDVLIDALNPILRHFFQDSVSYDFNGIPVTEVLNEIGYETYNPVVSLSTLGLLLVLWLGKGLVTFLILFPIQKTWGRSKKWYFRFKS